MILLDLITLDVKPWTGPALWGVLAHTHGIELIMQHRWEILSNTNNKHSWKILQHQQWIILAMNLLSSLIYCIKYGLEHDSQIGRCAIRLSSTCNALALEEAALHGAATEALTSRRQEWRGKSTLCRPKDISKHTYVLAQPGLMPLLIGLECGQSKHTSTAWMLPHRKLPWWNLPSFYSLSRERDYVGGMAPGEDGTFRGTV